jgi:hypothetical protein
MRTIGGGVWLALGTLTGAVVGILIEQITASILTGMGLGIAGAVITALIDAKKRDSFW